MRSESKDSELRKTGIGIVGDIPWGTHLCHFFETKEDLLEILVPFFKAGLENNEFCIWVVSDPLSEEEARNALRQALPEADQYLTAGRMEIVPHTRFPSSRQRTSSADQIEIIPHTDWYLKDGKFVAEQVLDGWKQKLEEALAKGYAGLRGNGNEAWLTPENWKAFSEYERTLNENLAGQRMIVLCSYPLTASSAAQIFDVVKEHQLGIVRRRGQWEIIETPELKQAKAEITKLNQELEQRVLDRTRALAEANEELRREIAERKRAEDVVRENQQLLQLVLATLPVGVAVMNRAGDIILFNEASKRIWGGVITAGRERWGQTKGYWHDSGKKIDSTNWASVRAISSGETSLNELIDIDTYDGQRKIIRNSAAPVRNSEGVIVGAVIVNEDVTERVRSEEALKESEAKLKEAQELAHIGYWERDLISDRIIWSEETQKIFAVQPPNHVFTPSELQKLIHPDDRQLQQQALDEALKGKGLYDVEYRIVRPSGEIRFVHVRDEIEYDEAGKPSRLFGAVQDITERKQAEVALRESEERFRELAENIDEVFWLSDSKHTTVYYVSPAYEKVWGRSCNSLYASPRSWIDAIHPEDRRRVVEVLGDHELQSAPDMVYRVVRPDGSTRWVHARGFPVHDENGTVVRVAGIAADITESKESENALRQSEFDLAEAQRVARIGSWTLDLATNAVRWSEELYRIFDVSKPAFGKTYDDFLSRIHPEDRARVVQANAAAKSTGKPFELEYRIKTRSGQVKGIRELGFARKNDAGVVSSLFGTAQDITERKLAERELKEAHRQLKILSRRRVKVQEEERRHLARELHDEIGQALTAAKINLQAATKESDGAQSKRIEDTAAILDRLLGQVRQISLDLRPSTLDDLGLVPALRSLLDEQGRRASVAVRFSAKDVPENLDPEIQTTCFRIAQEAITNAVRHAGAKRIDLNLARENGILRLKVRDDGKGFDAESAQAQAVGLGLLGMKERAALVGAQARIVSTPNKGTTVEVSLPLTSPPEREGREIGK